MDMDDNVGGLAGAMMSPAAFGIAKWGQRVGPFVGPMKSAMGFDIDDEFDLPVDDEFDLPAHTSGTLKLKEMKLKLKLKEAEDDLKNAEYDMEEAKDDVREEKKEYYEKLRKLQRIERVYKLKESRLAKVKALIMHENVELVSGTIKLEEAKDDLKKAEYALKQAKDDAREEKEEWHEKMQEFKQKARVYKLKKLRLAKVKALIMQKGERVEISAYDEDGEDNLGRGFGYNRCDSRCMAARVPARRL